MKAYGQIIEYLLLTIIVLTIFAGCSSIKVSQDYNAGIAFSALKTYSWKSETQGKTGNVQLDNPLLDTRIRTAVDNYLSGKGYRNVSEDQPDFFVSYQTTIQSKIVSNKSSASVGISGGSRGRRGGVSVGSGGGVSQEDHGSLVIDFTETTTDGLIWRGSGSDRIKQHSNPEKITQQVNEMVTKILGQFPPKSKR